MEANGRKASALHTLDSQSKTQGDQDIPQTLQETDLTVHKIHFRLPFLQNYPATWRLPRIDYSNSTDASLREGCEKLTFPIEATRRVAGHLKKPRPGNPDSRIFWAVKDLDDIETGNFEQIFLRAADSLGNRVLAREWTKDPLGGSMESHQPIIKEDCKRMARDISTFNAQSKVAWQTECEKRNINHWLIDVADATSSSGEEVEEEEMAAEHQPAKRAKIERTSGASTVLTVQRVKKPAAQSPEQAIPTDTRPSPQLADSTTIIDHPPESIAPSGFNTPSAAAHDQQQQALHQSMLHTQNLLVTLRDDKEKIVRRLQEEAEALTAIDKKITEVEKLHAWQVQALGQTE